MFVFGFKSIFAAEVNVIPIHWEIKKEQSFEVEISLATEGEQINAIEGVVSFPEDLLQLEEIKEGNSIINIWVEKPRLEKNRVIFSGIIPGGYKGDTGLIFVLTFKAKKQGSGVIGLENMETLQNDGKGTSVPLKMLQLAFNVQNEKVEIKKPSVQKDKEPPEKFVPEIGSDPSVFGGKWFAVFVAQDKKSGVERYEIKEAKSLLFGKGKKWLAAESPRLLSDQELKSYVWIKALDKEGNERIVRTSPKNPLPWYKNNESWFIIILGVVALFVGKKYGKKKNH